MLTGSTKPFTEDEEEVFVLVESTLGGCSLSVFIFFGSDAVFVDFAGFWGVVFFPRDPPNRSDSISSKPWRKYNNSIRLHVHVCPHDSYNHAVELS